VFAVGSGPGSSPARKWSFTINHAALVTEGIAGFLDAMPAVRLATVRSTTCCASAITRSSIVRRNTHSSDRSSATLPCERL